ncbi:MAG TPA: hypothetical protein VGI76_09010 [Solirubrobacteraceae bacterium]
MAERLFLFIQMELPWELGLADGRYLLRAEGNREPERVVVLGTLGAAQRGQAPGSPARYRGLAARRRPPVEPEPEPTPVTVTRTTVIDPVSVAAEGQARAWLSGLDAERETDVAAAALNRMLTAHRIATADPYVRELSPAQALVIRAGWGEGEQVAYGQWLHARELRLGDRRGRGRTAALRPQERLAALLAARQRPLACEELTLRARLDLDEGRLVLAALELQQAYATALVELPAEERVELDARLSELAELNPGVVLAAQAALSGGSEQPNAEAVTRALGRLEAALRARAAAGFHD